MVEVVPGRRSASDLSNIRVRLSGVKEREVGDQARSSAVPLLCHFNAQL